jgi:hypothetical protein
MRSEEERHTLSKIPKPTSITCAGGNGCRSHQEQGTLMNAFRRTIFIASLRAMLIEGEHKTSTEELRAFVSFPSFCLNSRKLRACS